MSAPVEILDSSDEDDIFVIKQIKPVNKLTLQEALIIKHGVLHSLNKKNSLVSSKSSKKRKKEVNNKTEKSKKAKKKSEKSKTKLNTPKKEEKKILKGDTSDAEPEIVLEIESPNKAIKESTIIKEAPEKQNFLEKRKSESLEILSEVPESKKKLLVCDNKKIKSEDSSSTDNIAIKEMNAIKNEGLLDNFLDDDFDDKSKITDLLSVIESTNNDIDEKMIVNNSELLCFIFKKIIKDEAKKQMNLESQTCENGKSVEKMLLQRDCEVLEKFFNLDENACKVYVRMLTRKKGWFQVSAINYKDISDNIEEEFKILHKEKFVDLNIEEEDLKTQLGMLNKVEILHLCKNFNVLLKPNFTKKDDLINLLIDNVKNQKSVFELMKGGNRRVDTLKAEVKKMLGMCIKLNETVRSTFNKIFFLFSFAHYNDEEDKRLQTQLSLCIRVFRNIEKFPNYILSPTVIFETRNDFENFYNAVLLHDVLRTAIACKRHDDFLLAGKKAKEEFEKVINDDEYKTRFMRLPSFLKKFSAGSVHASTLTSYCNNFKNKSDCNELVDILNLLLSQNSFLIGKRGRWYESLSLTYEQLKNREAAAEILIKGLQDPIVDEVQKLTLQLRGEALLKKKSNSLTNKSYRTALELLCNISVQEPLSIEICGKALNGNESGYKCVYIEETSNEKLFISVEERAIMYYKSIGFTKGYHTEGSIIQTIYFLLFFDIIYGFSPPGVFQTPYQHAPLDFYSSSFYKNRKNLIDSLLNEMCKWTDEDIEMRLKTVYYENLDVLSLIAWNEKYTPEMFCEILKCITMPVFVLICQRFIKNFKVSRSGFPDLTLWNPETKRCKFVEVKSPKDKLSPGQRIWLDYLRNLGIDCEVCKVKNVHSKVIR